MSEIMKIKDERETPKKNKDRKEQRQKRRVRAKWFCCAFKLGFLQLLCKASLTFKSNLELALSNALKERELYESTHVALECRCLNIWDLSYYFLCSSFLVLKWRQVLQIQLELQLGQVNLYSRRYFKLSGIGSLYEW